MAGMWVIALVVTWMITWRIHHTYGRRIRYWFSSWEREAADRERRKAAITTAAGTVVAHELDFVVSNVHLTTSKVDPRQVEGHVNHRGTNTSGEEPELGLYWAVAAIQAWARNGDMTLREESELGAEVSRQAYATVALAPESLTHLTTLSSAETAAYAAEQVREFLTNRRRALDLIEKSLLENGRMGDEELREALAADVPADDT